MRYLIRCGACGADALLTGELLSALSEQLLAFQAQHADGDAGFTVDAPPAVISLDAPVGASVAA